MDIKITDILNPACIELNLDVKDKTDALEKMVELLARNGKVADVKTLETVILDRERLMSTGIGNGVALPHGKTNVVDRSMAALATLANPIDFDALDDKPVSIVLLLVGTEANVGVHLRLLSRISRMVGSEQFRTALLAARTVDDVTNLLVANEEVRA
jgi:fructose-specific phosphotransferase system IIA component